MELFTVPPRTYATRERAIKAIKSRGFDETQNPELRYVIAVTGSGRFFPVFIGESAVHACAHFHFCTAG